MGEPRREPPSELPRADGSVEQYFKSVDLLFANCGQQIVHTKVSTGDFCSNLKQSFPFVEPANLSVDLGFQLTDSSICVRTASPMPKQFSKLAAERFLNAGKSFDFEAFVLERVKDPESHPSHLANDGILNLRFRRWFDPFASIQPFLKCAIYKFSRGCLEIRFSGWIRQAIEIGGGRKIEQN